MISCRVSSYMLFTTCNTHFGSLINLKKLYYLYTGRCHKTVKIEQYRLCHNDVIPVLVFFASSPPVSCS